MAGAVINPEVELVDFRGDSCLKFTFRGHLTSEDAELGVKEWRDFFNSTGGEKVVVIWDSTQMTGFDNKARIIWQHAIKEMKSQIECVWLITDSKVIKAGAKLMSLFTSFCLKVVDSSDKIAFSVLI